MENNKMPKVLFISHNAFSKTLNNGKTFSSLFLDWPPGKIAQLYFQTERPDFTICNDFFCLTDVDVLKRLLGKDGQGKKIENHEDAKEIKKNFSFIFRFIRNHPWAVLWLLRDVLWKLADWKSPALIKWLKDFSPDVVFFVGGNSCFAYDIALWICNTYNIPLIQFYTDDYLTARPTLDLFWFIRLITIQRAFRKMLKHLKGLLVIGEDMANEYQRRFGIECLSVMNCVEKVNSSKADSGSAYVIHMAYVGGLHLKRWHILALIGKCLMELNNECNVEVKLSIYSSQTPEQKVLNALTLQPVMTYKGSLDSDGVERVLRETDVLLHVESFKRSQRHTTRLSISTKIPEYLASGKCVLAVGPDEISSMRYLKKTRAAVIVNSPNKEAIKEALHQIVKDKDLRQRLGDNGRKAALEGHLGEVVRKKVKDILMDAVYDQVK